MKEALAEPAGGSGRAWLRWGLCFCLVLAVHSSALLLLRGSMSVMGPAVPEPIMMDLALEPAAAPAAAPLVPLVPEPPPPVPAPPEPAPIPAEPLPIPDDAPPVPRAEVPLPSPRPRVQRPRPRPRPAIVQTTTPQTEASPPPSVAAPPGPSASAPSGAVQATWEGELLAHIARFKRFPPAAQRRGEQGVVIMRVVLSRDGKVLAMSIVRSSGYADLDTEARDWMTRAEPLPNFPPGMAGQQIEVVIPMHFTLQ